MRVWLAPAVTPVVLDDIANVALIPGSSLEALMAQVRGWAESEAKAGIEPMRLAAASSARDAEVANSRAQRLAGDPDALSECSLEELRELVADIERGGKRARYGLLDSAHHIIKRIILNPRF